MIGVQKSILRKDQINDLSAEKLLDFNLPVELEANEPPEVRGLMRDQVNLMVSNYLSNQILHTKFRQIPEHLQPGDIVVVNASATMKAALTAFQQDGLLIELHLSSRLPAGLWIVELRQVTGEGTLPCLFEHPGDEIVLPGAARATLLTPYDSQLREIHSGKPVPVRLWIAAIELPMELEEYLDRFGFPIRYKYVHDQWPIEYYQNVYATEIGSAEMPSAGRAFTNEIIRRLNEKGVQVAPLILHTGVASLETHELPHDEYFRIPLETAEMVNATRQAGGRVIAVGTTVIRALETVVDRQRRIHPVEGWTDKIVHSDEELLSVDGLLTGFHEPSATHLAILAALAGYNHLRIAYKQALKQGYLWHEFGDLHLILP